MTKKEIDTSVLTDMERALDEAYEIGYRDGHSDAEIEMSKEE